MLLHKRYRSEKISIPFPDTRIDIKNHPEGGKDDLAQA